MTVFSVRNFGCRVNRAEAFSWSEKLQDGGFVEIDDWTRSDLILVNTCTLTGRADRDVRRFVRRAGRDNPEARIVVTGCLAERVPETFNDVPQVWMVLPNGAKEELADKILAEFPNPVPAAVPRVRRGRAVLKVQDGCDSRCAYCIIPSVRGPGRSLPLSDVLTSAADLAGRGYREVVLAGIHLASYGCDFDPPSSLVRLAEETARIPGVARVRLSSLDPRALNDDDIRRLADHPRICPHFHLSLQHASDAVLERMNRGRMSSRQAEILDLLRRLLPDAALGADFLVGFPGETDEEFEALYTFASASSLSYFHVFAFSPRTGTPAAAMSGPVSDAVKTERAARLRRLSGEKSRVFRERFGGCVRPGVVVGRRSGGAAVLTDNFIEVEVPSCSAALGDMVDIRVTQ
ncbi:MAG: MiaB/RimO family radical SAM methylthiotransferase [Acidobacteriota bacterium]|nr:MiaB/RimO family radical SAM methylthiotransferase [Acidobacteriota bacterium]